MFITSNEFNKDILDYKEVYSLAGLIDINTQLIRIMLDNKIDRIDYTLGCNKKTFRDESIKYTQESHILSDHLRETFKCEYYRCLGMSNDLCSVIGSIFGRVALLKEKGIKIKDKKVDSFFKFMEFGVLPVTIKEKTVIVGRDDTGRLINLYEYGNTTDVSN